jgi:hypothetical protein
MTLLTKDQIIGADDREFVEVDVPEWGGMVRLGSMTAAERDAFEAQFVDFKGKGKAKGDALKNFRARYVARCIVDEEGEPLFSAADMKALGDKSAAVISRLFDEASKLNGMSDKDVEELGEV